MKIMNQRQLTDNGGNPELRRLRSDAIKVLEAALEAADPKRAILERLQLSGDEVKVGDLRIPLSETAKIIVVGGGKAGGPMAEAVEEALGDRVTAGAVNVLRGTEVGFKLKHVRLNPASHPIPDEEGVRGVMAMMRLVSGLGEEDLVICLISGGGSSLMPLPAEGVTLDDIQGVTGRLLKAGATINELNSVRKHLSAFKGGQLAKACQPARMVSLILSDVVGDPLDTIASGPTAPDSTTYETAVDVMNKYGLLGSLSDGVMRRLVNGVEGLIAETPKADDSLFKGVHNLVVASNLTASERATARARELGYHSQLLTTHLEGEARHAGVFISGLARGATVNGLPCELPLALVLGGETTVAVKGNGVGGRNQELALSASKRIWGLNCVIAALGTDGIDGPTDAAGAIVDGTTLARALKKGLAPDAFLERNDSYSFFKALGDNIFTGPTGTNVNDLTLILCGLNQNE
jgi:glycerate 2-kinase